jgi:DNA-binding NarL/FixJ family response regulator
MNMSRKKFKKYEQSISTPFFEPAPGSELVPGLQTLITRFFGKTPAAGPTREEIINYHLTAREREIAYLAALGFSDKDIADALAMNFQTVRVHLRNLLNKLHLEDVHELREYFTPGGG